MKAASPFSREDGFTLVEIAIAIVIIGLLIGGILKGSELVRNAKVAGTISYVEGLTGAIESFKDKYNATPGDMINATQRVPGCAAPCNNGNGDGVIGILLDENTWSSTDQSGTSALPSRETTLYWYHLAAADLIKGVSYQAPLSPAVPGLTHPIAPVGGIFEISTAGMDVTQNSGGGIILRLQRGPGSAASGPFLNPIIASQIDMKIDDGNPIQGLVTGDFEGTGCGDIVIGKYNMDGSGACIMFFNLGRSHR